MLGHSRGYNSVSSVCTTSFVVHAGSQPGSQLCSCPPMFGAAESCSRSIAALMMHVSEKVVSADLSAAGRVGAVPPVHRERLPLVPQSAAGAHREGPAAAHLVHCGSR